MSLNAVQNPLLPWVVLLVDNSDSMSDFGGLIEQAVDKVRAEIGSEVNLGVARFANRYQGLVMNAPNPSSYGGNTALNTSIVQLLQDLSQGYGLDQHHKVFVAVITDGDDNASQHREPAVKAEVSVHENLLGYDFLYLGTCQAANEVAARLGVKVGKSLSFANTSKGFEYMLSTLTDTIKRWKGGTITHDREFIPEAAQQIQVDLGAII